MKQTAVEWLYEKIKSNIDAEDGSMYMNWLHDDTFQQAKEMEKQQIIEAFKRGTINEMNGIEEIGSEQYYNETFNK
jgi:hypothetical protein